MNKQDTDEIADIAAFRLAMRDVVPLKKNPSCLAQKKPVTFHHRPKVVQAFENDSPCTLFSSEYCTKIEPNSFLFEADSSLGHKVLRKFKQGQYNPEATLDLHGYTVNEAASALDNFIQRSSKQRLKTLLVIHGKGARAILKTQVNYWLKDHPRVLAFCSAKPKDGGTGAVYVLLKKQPSTGDDCEE